MNNGIVKNRNTAHGHFGHVEGVGSGELRDILGAGDVEVTFSLA